jgi:hypothetical protein
VANTKQPFARAKNPTSSHPRPNSSLPPAKKTCFVVYDVVDNTIGNGKDDKYDKLLRTCMVQSALSSNSKSEGQDEDIDVD